VSAAGGRQVRWDLCKLFLRAVVGQGAALQPAGSTPYRMDVFKNRQLSFPTDPADAISMRVQCLRLQVNGLPDNVTTCTPWVDGGPRTRWRH
jgi:hypothetical protein